MRFAFAVTLLGAAALLAAACSGKGVEQSSPPQSQLPVVYVPARWASANASSLDSLVKATGTIFVGTVTRSLGQQGLNPGGLRTADAPPDFKASFPVSSFEVQVVTVVTGDLKPGDTAVVDQPGGMVDQPQGAVLALLEGDERLKPGTTYLFFSTVKENGALTSPPFGRFEVAHGGELKALAAWRDLPVAAQLTGVTPAAATAAIRGSGE